MRVSTNNSDLDYDVALRDEFIELIAEFFRIPQAEARKRLDKDLQHPGSLVAAAWHLANPQSPDEVIRFYQETDSYVYDLAADHCRARRRPVWNTIVQRVERRGSAQNVLLYGDGIGTDSLALSRRGHQVTYFDLPGITANFARFRFEKAGFKHQITVVEGVDEIPPEAFDVIVCIEVLEHVTDPLGTMRCLHRALKYEGVALITESFESVGPDYPSHLPENSRYAGKTHQLMEALGFANTYYNSNPINRPMEFTKTRMGVSGSLLWLQGRLLRGVGSRWHRIKRAIAAAAS
jgi:SAM-dependent methyltransferase